MRRSASRIVVSGSICGSLHQGGAVASLFQYVRGLERLGHDVFLVEPVVDPPDATSISYFTSVTTAAGLSGRAAIVGREDAVAGVAYAQVAEFARSADLLVTVSGSLRDPGLVEEIPVRVYLDLDPAFAQLWSDVEGIDMGFRDHTHFVTVGQALGTAGCSVPTCGYRWITTFQPVVLDDWPRAERIMRDALTTIANWRGYGSIDHDGVHYGQKVHSLRQFIDLPMRTGERFVLALAIHPDETNDLAALDDNGWELVDPLQVARTPQDYRQFVQGSKGEVGIAKSGYVVSRSGWFSDRSACYLASGRPVIAQDTGFSRFLPTGDGLFAFETGDDVLVAIEALRADYERHARAARELAEEYFDSDKVLTRLLEHVGVA